MTDARETGRLGHVFRPGPFRRRQSYWLDGGVLHWRIGAREGHVELAGIASMRLDLPAGAGQAARCVLVERSGRVHRLSDLYWPRWTKEERHDWGRIQRREATFRGLTFTLARRLRKASPEARLQAGPSRAEWAATCLVAVLAIGIVVGGTALMVLRQTLHLPSAAFLAAVALYLPMLWSVIRSGGPRPLDPSTLHDADPGTGPPNG